MPASRSASRSGHGSGLHVAIAAAAGGASLAAGSLVLGFRIALLFRGVVLAHELGHYVVARVGRLAGSGPIVLFPLGGFVVMHVDRSPRPARAEAAIVAAGPLAGAVFGWLAAACWALTANPWARAFAEFSVWLNLVNLIPIGILDRGRLASLAGLPRGAGWVIAVPAAVSSVWVAATILPATIMGAFAESAAPGDDQLAVRKIAVGGWLAGIVALVLLHFHLQ